MTATTKAEPLQFLALDDFMRKYEGTGEKTAHEEPLFEDGE